MKKPKTKKKTVKKPTKKSTPQKSSPAILNDVYQHAKDIFYRETSENELSILNANIYDCYYKLDHWAAECWKMLDGKKNLDSIIRSLATKSGMKISEVTEEVESLIQNLVNEKLIRKIK